jgi:cytochrome c556
MIRGLTIAVAIVGLGISAVSAQQTDAPVALQNLMRANGKSMYGDLSKMVKGENPYSQATVDAALAQLEDAAQKLPSMFPEAAKTPAPGARFKPSAKIWAPENKADFDAKLADFTKSVQSVKGKIKDVEALKAGFTTINNACGGCHTTYQERT